MPVTDTTKLFAAYPHLSRIAEQWGSRACRVLLQNLMNDTRDGGRQGFPAEHASVIMSLLLEHDRDFPDFDDSAAGSWWEREQDRRSLKRD